jgi:ATP-dependent DNA helicase RecG
MSDEEEKVLEYIRIHGVITKNNAMKLLEVSASTASRVIRKMVRSNLLKQNGKARNTHYTIADK